MGARTETRAEVVRAVVLSHLHALLPCGLSESEVTAWLDAPVAGAPLLRRLIEPLLGTQIAEVIIPPAGIGRTLKARVEELGGFGLCFSSVPPASWAQTALFRSDRLGSFERRFELDEMVHGSGEDGRVDTAVRLRRTCALAIGAASQLRPVVGRWAGNLLRARRAFVERSVVVEGRCAVGAGTTVAADVRLGPGAIIGRGCRIDPGACVRNSVLLDGAHVEAYEVVDGIVRTPDRDIS